MRLCVCRIRSLYYSHCLQWGAYDNLYNVLLWFLVPDNLLLIIMSKEYFKKLREKRKALGVCLACGKHPAPCTPCRTRNRERMRVKRAGMPVEARQKTWKTSRDYFLIYKFGIDTRDYDSMLRKQNGGCAICNSPESGDSRTSNLAVDHCHTTGMVRGLLCAPCNKALGMFRDSPEIIRAAATYVERHQPKLNDQEKL